MSRVGPLLCPILVGRDDLLALADRRVAEASAGRGQLLLLAGEAGIGKTRLREAIERKARAAGFALGGGALAPQDRFVPAALFLDLARTVRRDPGFGSLGDDLLRMRAVVDADSLARRRLFVLDVVERLLEALDRPTLLVLEDLQWADELSLEIVAELARGTRDHAVLVVGTYRTDELPAGSILREWRSRLLGQRLAEEARLAPLTYDETALMTTLILGTGLPASREVVGAVYERTDGIPLHIEELLGALGEVAQTDGRAIRDANVPGTIEDAILTRFAHLSPEARAVAQAGAVIGRCFVPEVLAGIMDRPVGDLDAPLAELIDRSFLDPPGVRGLYDYRHQLLRDALYRTVPPSELRRLHARAGEFGAALEGASEVHASVHYERAGLRAQAFRTALAGARQAASISSRGEAFELYRRAIANLPDGLGVAEIAELYHAYCDAAAAVDDVELATELATVARERYLEVGRPLPAALLLDVLASFGRRQAAPIPERRALIERGLAEIEPIEPSAAREQVRAELLLTKALTEIDAMRLDDAAAAIQQARAIAEAVSEGEGLRHDVEFVESNLAVLAGQPQEGLTRMLRVARDARDAALEETGVTAFRNAGSLAIRVMDYQTADAAIREGLRYADAVEQSHCRHVMAASSAFLAWAAGRWEEAGAQAELELVERGCARGALGARLALGLVWMSRGRPELARPFLEETLRDSLASGEVGLELPVRWALAELDLHDGRPGEAAATCAIALEAARSSGERALLVPFVVTGVRSLLAANRPREAEEWVVTVRAALAGWDATARPALDHAEGLVRLSAGSIGLARGLLEAAAKGWTDRGRTWEAAWAGLDLAQVLLRSGRIGEAATRLAAVRAFAESQDGRPLLDRADALARVVRGRGGLEEPWRPLTAREFEVARLIAGGLTNAEIADELAIAPKTASAHVEHILAKLGVSRRAEVAAWATSIAASRSTSGSGTSAGHWSGGGDAARRRSLAVGRR